MSSAAEAHLADARALLDLLEREWQILHSGKAEALAAVCRDKLLCLRRLDILLATLKTPAGAAVNRAQRRALIELVLRCGEQTRSNALLLNARANRTRNALQAWHGPVGIYDVRGRGRYEVPRNLRSVA